MGGKEKGPYPFFLMPVLSKITEPSNLMLPVGLLCEVLARVFSALVPSQMNGHPKLIDLHKDLFSFAC